MLLKTPALIIAGQKGAISMFFHFYFLMTLLSISGLNLPNRHHHIHYSSRPIRTTITQPIKNPSITVIGTFYCGCPQCCGHWSNQLKTATGTTPIEGKTIAVDPQVIALGSQIIFIEVPAGLEYLKFNPNGSRKIFIAEDTGNPDFISGHRIDIFLNDHNLAIQLGVKQFVIEIIPPPI